MLMSSGKSTVCERMPRRPTANSGISSRSTPTTSLSMWYGRRSPYSSQTGCTEARVSGSRPPRLPSLQNTEGSGDCEKLSVSSPAAGSYS